MSPRVVSACIQSGEPGFRRKIPKSFHFSLSRGSHYQGEEKGFTLIREDKGSRFALMSKAYHGIDPHPKVLLT